ncbi:hypothetical protein [Amycolatopsis sp. DSM 110486]|uniref:hypothetical protein n=1 Tax=Amycolatopsis sp. DSM 110486 TaxID=2865832 RepID=UPI001C6A30F7|nr:hypothetical protein [Amycolatopsis sp. DSM 110486]QYN17583.1 hypothetical protein K1T34_32885 [Amycolatopsis sp. DSM 110486]
MSERTYDLSDFAKDGADKDLRLLDRHIPIVSNEWPSFNYITSVVVSLGDFGGCYVSPSDDELAMVASFHDEYTEHYYGGSGWFNRMRKRTPFDLDGGANGRFLCKYEHGGWALKVRTWEHGPRPMRNDKPMSLLAVLDRHHTIGNEPMPRWVDWKAARPKIFGK